jgi:hypothetical protein
LVVLALLIAAPALHTGAGPEGARPATASPGLAQDLPQATWPKPDRFWYRRFLPGGNVWIVVDARHGVREPLFDHQRLATELNLKSGSEFTPLNLPFADPAARFVMKYDGSNAYVQEGARAIEFVLYDYVWRCDLDNKWDWNKVPPTDYGCQALRPIVPAAGAAAGAGDGGARSPDDRWEAFIDGHDVVLRRVGGEAGALVRLSSDGTAEFPYERGSIEWSADSRTVAAYRVHRDVFLSENVTGRVDDLVVRGEWPVPAGGEP